MKHLRYATRGDSSPNNKPNVYFAAHPDDFSLYFALLSEEILQHSNCAIWYGEPDRDASNEEHLFNLDQMQLFVFPITSRFLAEKSAAIQEFHYAIEKHIPVLPIAVEMGLEKRFSDICGDIQFVDRTNTDITAIGYEEKLAHFISSVLIGDETAQKIRAAFDAYIFLSYRKKDRKYAQKLMRLIHQNDICRDIAIWYDEFLVPGEDFNDAIAEAMRNSAAFALAVTPNLLEKGNYVQQIEYPFAQSMGKHILPFEMLETDRHELEKQFNGLTECVNADEQSVSDYMVNILHRLAITPKERDSVHNFFIGLAYLNGMDLERDCKKAIVLISEAAESGLPLAMEKMVSIYREAEGVDRDYNRALKWQERYVERMKEIWREDPSPENLLGLFRAKADLISFYTEQNQFAEAKIQCEELHQMGTESGDSSILMYSLYFAPKIEEGLSAQGMSNSTPAVLYLKCCDVCRAEYQENSSQVALQLLAQCYLELGRIAYNDLQITIAREHYEKAIGYCRHLVEASGHHRYRELLAIMLSEHARTESFLNQMDIATGEMEEAIAISDALYAEYRTPEMCERLVDVHNRYGDILVKNKALQKAREHYLKAEGLINQYRQQTDGFAADVVLLDLYDNMAELSVAEERLDLAWDYYQKEEDIANRLSQYGRETNLSIVQWRIHLGRGGLLAKESRVDAALGEYIEADKIAERMSMDKNGLQQEGRYMRYITVTAIYSYTKEQRKTALAKQYRRLLLSKIPKVAIPSTDSLKELWCKGSMPGDISFDMLSTYGEFVGDMYSWAFEDDKVFGVNIQPILRWLKKYIYVWRIPFYPVLSVFMLITCHFVNGYSQLDRLSICYTDCLMGQIAYQFLSSIMMAICFGIVQKSGCFKRKGIWDGGAALLTSVIGGWLILNMFGSKSFLPDAGHVAYLMLPVGSAVCGYIVTKIVISILRRAVKE